MSGDSLSPTVAAAGSSRLLHTNAVTGNRLYLVITRSAFLDMGVNRLRVPD